MTTQEPTFIGQIASVDGSVVRIRLRDDMSTTFLLVKGQSYRVGQVGAFVRIPLGYVQLYAICTQIGADALPEGLAETEQLLEERSNREMHGYRWMTATLFGESLGGEFERGVGQYPTVGDEVHLATNSDLATIYGGTEEEDSVTVGRIAGASGIRARIGLSKLLTRHSAVLGSTGSGKSNFVTVFLEEISDNFPSSRCLVIDRHGEYADALGENARVFSLDAENTEGTRQLHVPYWGLRFNELRELLFGGLQPRTETELREIVKQKKIEAKATIDGAPPDEAITADSPIPFSVRQLWFELDDFERRTFNDTAQNDETICDLEQDGDPRTLTPNRYPSASPYNEAPYKNNKRRGIRRQLDNMKRRLQDSRLSFLLDPSGGYGPDLDGEVEADVDSLVADWIGHDRPVTIVDVSGIPSELTQLVVGTMLRVIYDVLYWGAGLPVGGQQQPLQIVLEEAHSFLREGGETPAHRTVKKIAKEGRKYGVGLMVVSQRPGEIDRTVLSQCGTLIALRMANQSDRNRVSGTLSDDFGGLMSLLPSLRTGEAVMLGEALAVPSRARIRRAERKPVGDDPALPGAWLMAENPDREHYRTAVANWRAQSED